MLLVAVLIGLGILALVLGASSSTSTAIANRQADETARVFAQVKEALIAWSVSRNPAVDGANARPGELPCPDINPYDGFEDGSCVAGALGRVPWKTLGIPEPKDAAGETLWYTIAGPFRKFNNSSAPITSDTLGNLTVYQDSTASTLSSQVVAVIFAPGDALDTQDRSSSTTMACSAPSGTYARNLCASNYLETSGGVNNATINGPFITAPSSSTFNDRLMLITNADLMPAVEQRVAREMVGYLNSYRAATGVYPWADLGDGNSNGSGSGGYNRNRFPCGSALPTAWASSGTPSLPNWLTNGCAPQTGWPSIVYYQVAQNRLEASGGSCTTCTANTLTITNSANRLATQCNTGNPPTCSPLVITSGSADLVLMTPGAANASPRGSWSTSAFVTIFGYFSDPNGTVNSNNTDNNDDQFYVPSTTDNNRARMFIVR